MFGFLEDVADAAVDVAGDIGGAIADVAGDVADGAGRAWGATTEGLGRAGGALGTAVSWGAEAVDTVTFGGAGALAGVADDYVFDTVDYATGGLVDVDFDDGAFSVGLGFDGMASLGASVGEHGISADGSLPGAELGLALTEEGIGIDGQAGIDYGPFPYGEGHLEVAADGDVIVNGHVQGTIPTPAGLLSGSVSGGFAESEEGWGAYVDADGTLRLPSGTTISGGLEASYLETATGSHTTFAAEGAVAMPGMGSIGGGIAYERLEEGGDVVEAFHAEAMAEGFGMSAGAEADHVSVTVDGVETSAWSGSAQLDLPGDDLDLSTDTVGDGLAAGGTTPAVAAADDGLDPFASGAGEPLAGFDDPIAPDTSAAAGPGFDDGSDAAFDGGFVEPAVAEAPPVDTFDTFDDVAAPAEPVGEFEGAIERADQVDASMDDLFEEI